MCFDSGFTSLGSSIERTLLFPKLATRTAQAPPRRCCCRPFPQSGRPTSSGCTRSATSIRWPLSPSFAHGNCLRLRPPATYANFCFRFPSPPLRVRMSVMRLKLGSETTGRVRSCSSSLLTSLILRGSWHRPPRNQRSAARIVRAVVGSMFLRQVAAPNVSCPSLASIRQPQWRRQRPAPDRSPPSDRAPPLYTAGGT